MTTTRKDDSLRWAKEALEQMIERLEPLVAATPLPQSEAFWRAATGTTTGKTFFSTAISMARTALDDRQPDRIVAAALVCAEIERQGQAAASRWPRRKGGHKTGQLQHDAAQQNWPLHLELYNEMVANGRMSPKAAREEVNKPLGFSPDYFRQRLAEEAKKKLKVS